MAEVENLVLVHVRPIRAAVDDLRVDMREVKSRLGILEGQCASLSNRLDRVGEGAGRIERRLDLIEA